MIDDPLNAFCHDSDVELPGAADGPLAGFRFAAKDIFDVAGHVCGCGNPDWKATHEKAVTTAWAIQVLVDAGAAMVGKTHTNELTRGVLGENVHYGTPTNPRAPGRVPGGSSSGSAAAVAGELVDFALGSDTGGSVRMPASFCGIFGMRPTHGRIPLDGMLIAAPSYDTIGWFARNAELFARVGEILLQCRVSSQQPARVVIAEDAFDAADENVATSLRPLAERVASMAANTVNLRLAPSGLDEWQSILPGVETLRSLHGWINRVNPRFGFDVAQRFASAMKWTDEDVAKAQSRRAAIIERMDKVLGESDVVCLPSSPFPPPPVGQTLTEQQACRERIAPLTCISGATGSPQISLPLAEVDGLPVGLSLLGARGSDELLLSFANDIALRLC